MVKDARTMEDMHDFRLQLTRETRTNMSMAIVERLAKDSPRILDMDSGQRVWTPWLSWQVWGILKVMGGYEYQDVRLLIGKEGYAPKHVILSGSTLPLIWPCKTVEVYLTPSPGTARNADPTDGLDANPDVIE